MGPFKSLYNGNIAASSVNIPQLTSGAYWIDRLYTYDQLNRIKGSTVYHANSMTGTPVHNGDYDELFTYDGNGNILSVNRSGTGTGTLKDILAYNYNRDAHGNLLNNQLNYLNGHAYASNITPDQSVNNYAYDPIGELTKDVQSGITGISWNVYGKIDTIKKAAGNITYAYGPGGQRVTKTSAGVTTYYIRDAQGNPLAIYDDKTGGINWREQHLYGSTRTGMWLPNVKLGTDSAVVSWDTIGRKQYELSNHLGNVLATITDKRLQHINGSSIDYFNADVATAQDYYVFGSLMPGRQYNYGQLYPNGFNGKRNDNDIAGTGNWQDYGQRMYLPWVGRFPSTDPLTKEYPALTPYQFASNSPVAGQDRDGLEFIESGAYAIMQNRQYEANLRKTDPKNADAIIRQHNVNAFLVVGGALTAGSGTLATAFWDLIMTGGGVRTAQGIINHDKTQTSEGVHAMTSAAMGEIGGFIIGKTFETISPILAKIPLTSKRLNLAIEWMGGIEKAKYVDVNAPVFATEIKVGTKLIQFRLDGQQGYTGDYYALPGTTPEEIGIPSERVVKTLKVTVNKPTNALVSTHTKDATFYADPSVKVQGGGKQIYSKDLKNNITIEQ